MRTRCDDALGDTVAPGEAATDATLASGDSAGSDVSGRTDGLPEVRALYYRIDRELSRGGMGRILVAHDYRVGRPVAIKEATVRDAVARRRFEREAVITGRLQHPSIVPVYEVGRWPSGEAFYAMKLVDGRPLRRCIEEARTIAGRLALLPNVVAVADALAYAHSRRVIHRDLKPDNVLVGDYGETIVIDWGLAKQLDATEDEIADATPSPPAADGGDQTVAGSALGTPVYMPPEQALGEPADERSDVYAIGAMLYHLLTGQVPYADSRSTIEVIERVIKGPPRAVRELAPDAPVDLLTIVEKAMARDPADRYPSARELADDLRRYTTGQLVGAHRYSTWQLVRRWVARNKAPVLVALAALTILVAVGVVALTRIMRAEDHAQAQRARAEQQGAVAAESRGQAEDLLGFMLVDLRDKLRPLGKLELLDEVARRAVAYYDKRTDELAAGELVTRRYALRNLGDVLFDQGHTEDALVEYRAALALDERLVAEEPSSVERRVSLAASRARIARVLHQQGDLAAALEAYEVSGAITEALVAEHPSDPAHRRELAVHHGRVGNLLQAMGRSEDAQGLLQRSLEAFSALAREAPNDLDAQADLALAHDRLGSLLESLGDSGSALAEYRTSVAMREAIVAAAPTDTGRRQALAVAYRSLGIALAGRGDADAALTTFRSALKTLEALAAGDPTNAVVRRDLATAHSDAAVMLHRMGDLEGARVQHLAAVELAEALAAADPDNRSVAKGLATSLGQLGRVLLGLGRTDEALVVLMRGQEIAKQAAAAELSNPDAQQTVSVQHNLIGDVLMSKGNITQAEVEFRAGLAIVVALSEQDPANTGWLRDVAVSHSKLAEVALTRDDLVAAIAAYREVVAIMERLAQLDPSSPGRRRELATVRVMLADALVAGRDPAARDEYRAALRILEDLAKEGADAELAAEIEGLRPKAK